MSDFIYQPYTYLIGWSDHNVYYYGVRYAKSCNPTELWSTYFTSSKYVKEFAAVNGAPDIIEIRKIFTNADKARLWEHKVLKRLKVNTNRRFLNQSDNVSISSEAALRGAKKKKSAETRRKMSIYQSSKKLSKETRLRISSTKTGVPFTQDQIKYRKQVMNKPEVRNKLSEIGKTKVGAKNNFFGKVHSDSSKRAISESKMGMKAPNAKSVIIDGIEYESIKKASLETGISKHLIRKMMKNEYL
jgi:hypothetical protein